MIKAVAKPSCQTEPSDSGSISIKTTGSSIIKIASISINKIVVVLKSPKYVSSSIKLAGVSSFKIAKLGISSIKITEAWE